VAGHTRVVFQEKPVVDNQDHLMTRENPILHNQDDVMIWDGSVVGSQTDFMSRDEPLVWNQSQDIDDPSVQMELKCVLNPCRRRTELSNQGGDAGASVKATDVQKSHSCIEHVSGGRRFPAGKKANDVPDCTTSKPHPTVEDPSRCVWAIVSCCSPGSNKIRHPCFELLGCPGPFWDTNPCNKGMTAAAVKVVHQFYTSGKRQ
jgi:hypothetical protein